MPKFSEKIYKVGVNPCVEVPRRVTNDLGKTGYAPVAGTINGTPFRSTLVPVGSGRHRLYINGAMRKDAGVGVGDLITVRLDNEDEPRGLPTPPQLMEALSSRPRAKAEYDAYPPSRRREILAYLNSLKKPETLERNIDKLVAQLEEARGAGAQPSED